MKLLLDMNLPPRLAELLQFAGFDAQHWSLVGNCSASDSEILSFAAQDGAAVVTHDLDFSAILAATGANSPSVVQIRTDDLRAEILLRPLVSTLNNLRQEIGQGAVVSLDVRGARARLLPLRRRNS
jgi:predicted nuclease of predicted toxin-antitoxin system